MNRCAFDSGPASLSHLLLAWLSPALSLFFLGWLMFTIMGACKSVECGIPLKLFAGGEEGPPIEAGSPVIHILESGTVEFNGRPCDPRHAKLLPGLTQRILRHRDSAPEQQIAIRADPLSRHERIIDVLNAFEKCGHRRYRLTILPLNPSPDGGPH